MAGSRRIAKPKRLARKPQSRPRIKARQRPAKPSRGSIVLWNGPRGGLQRQSKSGVWYSVVRRRYTGHAVNKQKPQYNGRGGYHGHNGPGWFVQPNSGRKSPRNRGHPRAQPSASSVTSYGGGMTDEEYGQRPPHTRHTVDVYPGDNASNFRVGLGVFQAMPGGTLEESIRMIEAEGLIVERVPPRQMDRGVVGAPKDTQWIGDGWATPFLEVPQRPILPAPLATQPRGPADDDNW